MGSKGGEVALGFIGNGVKERYSTIKRGEAQQISSGLWEPDTVAICGPEAYVARRLRHCG